MWDPRSAFDTIVQSSTVDLFHACSIAVAPLARSSNASRLLGKERLLGSIQFSSAALTGSATLCVPRVVYEASSSATPGSSGNDWIREQTNQLVGRIKKRLTQLQVTLQTGLPSIPTPDRIQRLQTSNTASVYEFRALRGEILVVLDATIDYSALVYLGALNLANEGDIILF
jgi:hypothetical protein